MNAEIIIEKAVLHILDNTMAEPVISSGEMECNAEVADFLQKHIEKIMEDGNLKNAEFSGDEPNCVLDLCKKLAVNKDIFLEVSIGLAMRLFDIMSKNADIPPADLLCCLFTYNGEPGLGILKLNYKTGFTHYVDCDENGNTNTIIRYRTILPSESQKVDECALINLENFRLGLLEKEYEINGQKENYFSMLFIQCTTDLSGREKLKILEKAAAKVCKKYFDEDFEKMAKFKKAVSESLEEDSVIEVEPMLDEVFENNIEVRQECLEEMQKAGLKDATFTIPQNLAEKKYRTHTIKTDSGIEINFPLSYYNNKDMIEFINNPDGTVSILIKNVGRIVNGR